MTEQEFEEYGEHLWEDYAQERARNLGTTIEEERATAAQQRETLLPEGQRSAGHFFWKGVDESAGTVGNLWVFVDEGKRRAFIYDIEMDAAQRGRGYGTQTLAALEDQLKPLGVRRIGLNVFGDNAVAQHLYQKVGYRTVAAQMEKDIS